MTDTADPLVSVIVRTKDRPEFLQRALRSITAQTLSRWECIIVNDGGEARRVDALIAALAPHHAARVTAVHHRESRGRWKSANAGVLASRAPLITIHDDDDSWHPAFLETATGYLKENPERGAVVARIEIVWEEWHGNALAETGREVFQPHLHDLLLSDALLFNRFVPIGFVYRRSLHEDLGLYDESLPVVGDWDFNLKILAREPLEFVGENPLAFWHQRVGTDGAHGNSVITARSDHEKYDARIRDEALRAYVAENGLGLVLYLTSFIDRRFVEVEAGIRSEIAAPRRADHVAERMQRAFQRLTPWRRHHRHNDFPSG